MDVPNEKTENLDDESTLEGEDFLCRLTDEEKECLQYLLETIDSLDQDEDENANNDPDKEHLRNSAGLQDLDRNQKGLTENVKQSDKTEQDPSPSKMKIVKSFSEDCPGLSITVTPDTGQKSTGSHPNHLRKFDTIMRSGVNVQELRARFIRQQGNASFEEASKVTELSSSSKQLPQVTHNRMSPRQEALQKLGLLQINQSKINTPEEPHGTDQNSAVKNYEINQNHSKAGSNLSRSLERKPGAFDKVWPP
ncbi:uncharacterized protein LOC130275990 isoform X2 [Hyla sarda]|uniref:uncharacterized protein LOC130275990 isoform X2 n=1 Tax=Hyla sarda TaxID=327740 RepID=UPI0024C262FD|nr:uncharacterized protein LOC130275990 isoform X2 [Hyla sarda]XP_056380737.1 uncharacterized protein LOC130275990 isoform X2 [Hyla sarda]XP_056380738.1 uncharacterized protein LOC130275990 isoform X2 [Hyla sarda]XP_056380739.1 uncharacterized protein LOC130275990 isoform X2 [Hyla sarda]XP_056380740.1 uncharacterized protein LOC130275990 isoform X2 [Hyla sarda]